LFPELAAPVERRARRAVLRKPAARAAQDFCALMREATDPELKSFYRAQMIAALLALDETRGAH